MAGMALKLLGKKISNVGGRRNGLLTSVVAMSSKSGDLPEEWLPLRTILENINSNTEQMVTGMKDLVTGIKGLQVQGETSTKILRHLSQSRDHYLRSDVRSTEQEVTTAAHAFAKKMFGEPVEDPEFNHFVRDRKTRKKILELDGYFFLESNVVGIVEAKRHVTEVDVTTLLLKGSTTVKEEGFTGSVLFIGGPVVDNRAKTYAQAEGIYVLEFSGNRYAIKGVTKSLESYGFDM